MHGFSSVVATLGSHFFPPQRRLGLVQVLCLLCLPCSHNWSHLPHSLHSVNPPSTKTAIFTLRTIYKSYGFLWNSFFFEIKTCMSQMIKRLSTRVGTKIYTIRNAFDLIPIGIRRKVVLILYIFF